MSKFNGSGPTPQSGETIEQFFSELLSEIPAIVRYAHWTLGLPTDPSQVEDAAQQVILQLQDFGLRELYIYRSSGWEENLNN